MGLAELVACCKRSNSLTTLISTLGFVARIVTVVALISEVVAGVDETPELLSTHVVFE